jgi:hypothetical protein
MSKEGEPVTIDIGITQPGLSILQLPWPFTNQGVVAWTGDVNRMAAVSYRQSLKVALVNDPNKPKELDFPIKNPAGEIILGSQLIIYLTYIPE